jgi:hypothetical protein
MTSFQKFNVIFQMPQGSSNAIRGSLPDSIASNFFDRQRYVTTLSMESFPFWTLVERVLTGKILTGKFQPENFPPIR